MSYRNESTKTPGCLHQRNVINVVMRNKWVGVT